MVMSPFELSVCVYFHLHCWHVVLNLLPFCPSKLLTLSDLSYCSLYHCSGFSRYSLLTEVYDYCPFCKGIFQTLIAVTLILINCCESESKGGRKKCVFNCTGYLVEGLDNLLAFHYTVIYIQINFNSQHFACISCDRLNFCSDLCGS